MFNKRPGNAKHLQKKSGGPKIMRKNKRFFVANQTGDLGETEEPSLHKNGSGNLQPRLKKPQNVFDSKRRSGRGQSPFLNGNV